LNVCPARQNGAFILFPCLIAAVTCDDPPAVPNAEVTVQGLNIDDTALYRCDAGYAIDIPYLTSFCVLDEKNEAAAVWQPVPQCLGIYQHRSMFPPTAIKNHPLTDIHVDRWESDSPTWGPTHLPSYQTTTTHTFTDLTPTHRLMLPPTLFSICILLQKSSRFHMLNHLSVNVHRQMQL